MNTPDQVIRSIDIDELQYYITPQHTCSYLEHHLARMVFLDPSYPVDEITLSALSRAGFRRSGDFIYRPECLQCRQCLSCRVLVKQFNANSMQYKALRRNRDIELNIRSTHDYEDYHYQLYAQYIEQRHYDGDMYPPSKDQFEKFLIHSTVNSVFLEFWLDKKLICVTVCDHLDDGMSAIYTFYDVTYSKRSLGTYAILQLIDYTLSLNLDYVYLGYWVPHSRKMRYKIQYLPLEVNFENQWHLFDKPLQQEEIDVLGWSLMQQSN